MSPGPELLAKLTVAPPTREHCLIFVQLLLYFFCGQAVRTLCCLRLDPLSRRPAHHVAPYVACGAIWLHFTAFLWLWAGAPSMLAAHLLALLPFAGLALIRPRDLWNFDKRWALVVLALLVAASYPASHGLFQSRPQVWDEFTQWASRPRQFFLLDRLPQSTDGVAVVFPHYGLFSNLVAVWSYVLCGYEATGVATCWSLLFTVLTAIHLYEILRVARVSKLVAASACTLLLAALCRHQSLLVTTMYADIYVLVGAALAAPHLFSAISRSTRSPSPGEDVLLASSGLAILMFIKSTGEISAGAILLYAGAILFLRAVRDRRRLGMFATPAPWTMLGAALAVRGCWAAYIALNGPDLSQALLQQGESFSTKISLNPRPLMVIAGELARGLWAREPYPVLLGLLAAGWSIRLLHWRAWRSRPMPESVSALALWPVVMFAALVAVYKLVPSLPAADVDRYALAIVPGAMVYGVVVLDKLFRAGEREAAWYARPDGFPAGA